MAVKPNLEEVDITFLRQSRCGSLGKNILVSTNIFIQHIHKITIEQIKKC